MIATEEKTSNSLFLEDKGKVVSYPGDMHDMDIAFHVGVNEYNKSPRNALLEAIATNPIISKGLDFAASAFTPKEWEELGNKAVTAIMAVPKLEAGLINKFNRTITFRNTEGVDQEIAESSMVIGEEMLKGIARVYEPIRPIVAGAINKTPAGEVAKDVTRSIFKPEDTKSIISQTAPFQEWEQGEWTHLIPRAIGEAIESVLVYSNLAKNIPELLNNYQISKVRTGLTELSETLKNKLVSQGYSEEEAVRILLDPGTQNFIRQTPVFKNITGQGIVKMYSGGIDFKPGDIVQLGKETANILRIEGTNAVLKAGAAEIIKPLAELKRPILNNINPTGSVFSDYAPEIIAKMKLGDNITTLDKTMGKPAEEMITIYRGVPKGQKEIVAGDFITTNKQLAKDYAGTGIVIEKKVKLSDILDDKTEPLGEEYIYKPQETAIKNKPKGFDWKPRGFVGSVNEEMPQLKVSGQYVPRSTDRLAIKARTLINSDLPTAENMAATGLDDASIATGSELLKYYCDKAKAATDAITSNAYYDKAAELGNSMAKRLTELGRAVQAAAILGRLTPEGQLKFAAKTIQKYNTDIEKAQGGLIGTKKPIPELTNEQSKEILTRMEEIKTMPEGEQKAMAFRDLQNYITDLVPTPIFSKIVTLWKAGLLTGIKTSGLNIFANFSHAFGTEVIKDIPAAMVDNLAALFTKKRTSAVSIKGLKGTIEGAKKAWRFLKTGYDERNVLDKLDYKRVNFGNSKVGKALQKYEETVFGILGAEDQPFYYASKARSVSEQALVKSINKGLTGTEQVKFINDLMENPTDDMLVLAVSDAEISVFQNPTELGKLAKLAQNAEIFGFPIGELVLPFSKTPSAVAMQILNYSPAGFANALRIMTKGFKQKDYEWQRDFSKTMGRAITGTMIIAFGSWLFRKGLINLERPKTEKEQKLWELEGRTANSIKLGGKWRTVQSFGPAGNLLLIGGHFQDAFDNSGSPTEAIGKTLFGSAKSFTEQTFLKSVNTFSEAFSDPERMGEQAIAGLVSSIVPTLVKDVGYATDKKVRRAENIYQKLQDRLPIFRSYLEPKIDVLGKEVYKKENFLEILADPTRPSTEQNEPVIEEIRKLTEEGFNINTSQLGTKKGFSILTQIQNTEMWQRAGSIAYDKINSFIKLEEYQNIPSDLKAKKIDEIFDKAKIIARVEKLLEITQGLQGEELKNKLSESKKDGLLNREVYNQYLKFR